MGACWCPGTWMSGMLRWLPASKHWAAFVVVVVLFVVVVAAALLLLLVVVFCCCCFECHDLLKG